MNSNVTFLPKIINNQIGGIFNESQINISQIYSKFGNISSTFLHTLSTILKPIIEIASGTFLRIGVPIPLIESVELANRNQLIIFDNILRLDTDLVYASNFTRKRILQKNPIKNEKRKIKF